MADAFHLDQSFENIEHQSHALERGEYENCSFSKCNFSNGDLSNYSFLDCTFTDCDLSMVKFANSGLKEVEFFNCKMLGILFEECLPFLLAMRFDHCQLNYCSFSGLKLKTTHFTSCALNEADFSNSDLTAAVFDECKLTGTIFNQTLLAKADFRTAIGFDIDPESNRIRGAKFSKDALSGLLTKYSLQLS